MSNRAIQVHCVGDVLTAPLSGIAASIPEREVFVYHYGIDQHFQVLISEDQPDVLICHAMAEFFLRGGSSTSQAEINARDYCAAALAYAKRGHTVVILNTVLPPLEWVVGVTHIARLRAIARINDMIFTCSDGSPMVSIVDLANQIARIGAGKALSRQGGFVMGMPYTGYAIPPIVDAYVRAVRERFLPRKKALLLDADNTLWHGLVGEDGADGIEIGPEFPGIVYRRFQESLLELRSSGVLLCLVSQNNAVDVREAFEKRDMPLRWNDFAATRVNWAPKSENIAAIESELNLSRDSFVFIDDSEFEIDQVRTYLPEVDCYRFDGRKPDESLSLISRIKDLGAWSVTAEDSRKAEYYNAEVQRKALLRAGATLEEYLGSLGIGIEVGVNRRSQVTRVSQLMNKTNQFNLTTRRYSESDIEALSLNGRVYDFRVIDRFGDMGVVGVVVVSDGEIDTFLLSCRALGRTIESHMLRHVCDAAWGISLKASYIPTPKNGIAANFYDKNGFMLERTDSDIKHYRAAAGPICSVSIDIWGAEDDRLP